MSGSGREVVLGVGGGIAAYKSCDLLRRLLDHGYQVTVVPTPSSLNFVGAATWEALSGRTVTAEVFQAVDQVRHIGLAKLANYLLIAPATADLLARIAAGRADDLLTNVVLAAKVPTLIVPAMHPTMWQNLATQENVKRLRERGYVVMDPAVGALTSGDIGQGRFPDTSEILKVFESVVHESQDLTGRKVLITAGGTREPIDPVRFIGNRSSGKQGYAAAKAAHARGAEVTLISANTSLADISGVKTIKVETTAEMMREFDRHFDGSDIIFMAAAIADARPLHLPSEKIKKADLRVIELTPNPDLLATITKRKKGQYVIAFAAETSSDIAEAKLKMERKGADLIYLNDVSAGAIFNAETTHGFIIEKNGHVQQVAETTKDTLADELLTIAQHQLG